MEKLENRFLYVFRLKMIFDKASRPCLRCFDRSTHSDYYTITGNSKEEAIFREAWNNSLCKNCIYYKNCGTLVLKECGKFKQISCDENSQEEC